jgi:hypothetical protein
LITARSLIETTVGVAMIVSAVLSIAMSALWVRSYAHQDMFFVRHDLSAPGYLEGPTFTSDRGLFRMYVWGERDRTYGWPSDDQGPPPEALYQIILRDWPGWRFLGLLFVKTPAGTELFFTPDWMIVVAFAILPFSGITRFTWLRWRNQHDRVSAKTPGNLNSQFYVERSRVGSEMRSDGLRLCGET